MDINEKCVVALTWVLQDTLSETLDVLDEPTEFLVGGTDLLVRVEEALQGHAAGAKLSLHLEPADAFGNYQEHLLFMEPRLLFPSDIEEGMVFEGSSLPDNVSPDMPRDLLYTVAQLYPDHVILDGNHPLAGIALRLHLQVHNVREAIIEEVGSGTAGTKFFRLGER